MHRPALLALLLTLALPAPAQTLEMLVYPNVGVFSVGPGGEATGPGTKMLKRLADVSELTLDLRPVPIARALHILQTQPRTCAAGMPRTPDREPLYRWAGLMASGAMVLYARPEDTREITTPDDLRGASIVVQRESYPQLWLRQHGLAAHEVGDTDTGLRILRAGRVDFWLVNDLLAQRAIQFTEGPRPKALREFGHIELYVACHRELPQATAERLAHGLETLRRNGELVNFGLR